MNNISSNILNRKSYRSYQNRSVEDKKIKKILQAVLTAPSAHHKRAWEFVVVQNKEVLNKLGQSTRWSQHISQAGAAIVITSPEWENWVEDCSVVATYIYLEATNQGLGTCWTQIRKGERADNQNAEEYIKNLLNIPKENRILCLMPLGYPRNKKQAHNIKDQELKQLEKVHLEKFRDN